MAVTTSTEASQELQPPPLSALALIGFDQRRGNSVLWQQTVSGLELGGGLEYKALPSGLHTLESDLIYFVHNGQAGISAFENVPDEAAKRGASFYAVAALTSREGSRLGRVWLHASRLQVLAASLRDLMLSTDGPADDQRPAEPPIRPQAAHKLEEYWQKFSLADSSTKTDSKPQNDSATSPQQTRKRRRGMSESVPFAEAPDTHPASSMSLLLDLLGPLIFPLYRHTLLRKKILIVRKPPLQQPCNFVYLLSILSNVPVAVAEELPSASPSQEPLFAVGVYDLTDLERRAKQADAVSWIVCSSDELLATKNRLYDIKIEFPPPTEAETNPRWPTLTSGDGLSIKATQRDLRHYRALRARINALYQPSPSSDRYRDDEGTHQHDDVDTNEHAALLPHHDAEPPTADPTTYPIDDEASVSEPQPWAAIAYDSFIWWASAGERDTDWMEEQDFDQDLLDSAFAEARPESPAPRRRSMSMTSRAGGGENFEMSVVAYFQRMTAVVLQRLIEIVPAREGASAGGSEDDGESAAREKGFVTKDDLIKMGLDVWSMSDRAFLQELAKTYLNAEVEVQGKSVDCCGVRTL